MCFSQLRKLRELSLKREHEQQHPDVCSMPSRYSSDDVDLVTLLTVNKSKKAKIQKNHDRLCAGNSDDQGRHTHSSQERKYVTLEHMKKTVAYSARA